MSRSNESLALLMLLDATAETARETGQQRREQRAAAERARIAAEAEAVRQQAAMAAERRRGGDAFAMMVAAGLAVTVLGPWLIGHFLMTETFVLSPDERVYDDEIRGISDHFWATYLGGLVPVVLLLGVFLVARPPWQGRKRTVVVGWIAIGATLVLLLPTAMNKWQRAENMSAIKLRETAFPFADRYLDCASWNIGGENGVQQRELWQVHLGQLKGTPGRGCNRVNIYRGWEFVTAYNLPEGNFFTGDIVVNYPGWTEPYESSSSGDIYSVSTKTGVRNPMNPNATNIDLMTETGQRLVFPLAGEGPFELR